VIKRFDTDVGGLTPSQFDLTFDGVETPVAKRRMSDLYSYEAGEVVKVDGVGGVQKWREAVDSLTCGPMSRAPSRSRKLNTMAYTGHHHHFYPPNLDFQISHTTPHLSALQTKH